MLKKKAIAIWYKLWIIVSENEGHLGHLYQDNKDILNNYLINYL